MSVIFLKAAGITTFSVLVSLGIVAAIGVDLSGNALILSILCPLVIAFPASAFTTWQKERVALLHSELMEAHQALKEAHDRLAEKSRRDDMTGFLNRESFFSAIDGTRRRTDRGAMLLVDADHFKAINDTYGHLVGDDALLEIAAAIGRAVRQGDIVGRIGGEEFGVLLTGADLAEARKVAERIRAEVERATFMPAQGQTRTLTVSIGGTLCWPDAGISDIMRDADRRLYLAKDAGRNRVALDPERRLAA